MDLGIITLREVRYRKTNIIRYYLYVEPEKWQKWTYLQKRKTLMNIKKKNNNLMITKGEREVEG